MAELREVKQTQTDGEIVTVVKLRCPGCGLWAELDDDQLHGRVSTDCPECSYHETHDFAAGDG